MTIVNYDTPSFYNINQRRNTGAAADVRGKLTKKIRLTRNKINVSYVPLRYE